MTRLLAAFQPKFVNSLVFMLQASEYDPGDFLAWFWRTQNFQSVAKRGQLDLTSKARLLRLCARVMLGLSVLATGCMVYRAFSTPLWLVPAIALVLITPVLIAYALVALLWVGRVTVQGPQERKIIARPQMQLASHPGLRIAVAGSYGKTSFKEILRAVLTQSKTVAATPGNMNTPIGISRFIATLAGDEDVLIFELGEYYPGDIAELCSLVKPEIGIITGINEAHLSKFKTLERTTATIFELADYLGHKPVYKNGENELVRDRAGRDPLLYTVAGVNGWKVTDISIHVTGTSFMARKGDKSVKIESGMLGRHIIGPLVAAIDIADRLGLTYPQIATGLSHTSPVEHRMQPRQLAGAWIVDDTYNGNSDGVKAGLAWLKEVPAKRRIYVTPGLVEQGSATESVHLAIGRQIAAVADVVVLMKNSTTAYIEAGLTSAHYHGELKIVDDPLRFYQHVDQFVADGDVMLMQNDWTDNYS